MTGGARTETSLGGSEAETERGKIDSGSSSSGRNSGSSGMSRIERSMSSTIAGGDPTSSFLVGLEAAKLRRGGVGVKSGVLYVAFMFEVGRGEKSSSPTGFGSGRGRSFLEASRRALKSFNTSRGSLLLPVVALSRFGSMVVRCTVKTGACFPSSLRPRMYGAGSAEGNDVVRDMASVGRDADVRKGGSACFFFWLVPKRSSNNCASSSRNPPGALLEGCSRLEGPMLGSELAGSRTGDETMETTSPPPPVGPFLPVDG